MSWRPSLGCLGGCTLLLAATAFGQAGTATTRADSLYDAGERAAAAAAYRAMLDRNPEDSHATFRLAQLSRDPREAERLYRRYVALEPRDAWGHMALGNQLARRGHRAAALHEYAVAERLAPHERDVAVGRARILGRGVPEPAITAYRSWLEAHPDDAEAWRELGRLLLRAGRPQGAAQAFARAEKLAPDAGSAERLRQARSQAAPALEPGGVGSADSDGNHRVGGLLRADVMVVDGARLGLGGDYLRVSTIASVASVARAGLLLALRPHSTTRLDASLGAQRLALENGSAAFTTPSGSLRLRWRQPSGAPAFQASLQRTALDASPLLLANHVVRNEAMGELVLPAGPLRLRGSGRLARLEASNEHNRRTRVSGALALPLGETAELSAQYHRMSYEHSTTAGYFAPRLAETLEGGTSVELGSGDPFTLALDLGAGAQRVAAQGGRPGGWRRALRGYGYLTARLGRASQLALEVEAYDAAIATEGVSTTAAGWRYGSAALSLRFALR